MMTKFRRAALAALILALPGCFRSTPLKDDTGNPTDSAEKTTEGGSTDSTVPETTDSFKWPTDEATDSTEKPTDTQSSDSVTDSAEKPTDERGSDSITDSAEKPTDAQGSDEVSTGETDSAERATESETASVDTAPPRIPEVHRAVSELCDSERQVPEPTELDAGAQCTSHADCQDTGENGRCEGYTGYGRVLGYTCTYDACFTDDDCPAGGVCKCGGDHGNYCLSQGNCRIDKDCGATGYCSPTLGDCGHYFTDVGYYCHTPEDECVDDADCANEGTGGWYCAYNLVVGRWTCSDAECEG